MQTVCGIRRKEVVIPRIHLVVDLRPICPMHIRSPLLSHRHTHTDTYIFIALCVIDQNSNSILYYDFISFKDTPYIAIEHTPSTSGEREREVS